ncbi:MAG: hypothetical protein WBA10_18035 [Elainellaceae cyanobacterium]
MQSPKRFVPKCDRSAHRAVFMQTYGKQDPSKYLKIPVNAY